tara:strand:+ start:2724 stop:2942 length:219 start_codon:yes stop_codon:yes gene_type:complete
MKIVGKKIDKIVPLSIEDCSSECWDYENEATAVIVLENGIRLYASRDYEGNGPGALFGRKGDKVFTLEANQK